jgi:hypothetical protein
MIETVEDVASVVTRLSERVQGLERRVAMLEGQQAKASAAEVVIARVEAQTEPEAAKEPELLIPPLLRKMPAKNPAGAPAAETPAGVITVLGKAVLGIAGAYLLRAIAESGAVPKMAVLLLAITYACLWMVWAVRARTSSRFASVTYAVTSAMILAPLLWESTVRFQTLSPRFTAVVLAGYLGLTLALAAKHNLELLTWVATAASVATAVALLFTTHDFVPLTTALLAIAVASEVSGCVGHRLTQRVLPALAVDFAIWQLVDVMTSGRMAPEGYQATSAGVLSALCLGLMATYGGSIGVRGFARREAITYFDVGQGASAFGLGTFGVLQATQWSMAPTLGVLFVALAAVCYWGALWRFVDESHARNRRVSATWAAALLVAGSWLLLPLSLLVLFLCVAAVVAAFLYSSTGKFSLGLHASVYLAAATAVSSAPGYVISAMAGSVPAAPGWDVWVVALAAGVSYIVGARHAEERIVRRVLWVIPALLAGFAVAAVAVSAIVGLTGGSAGLAASRLSVVRTIVGCAVALALAFAGAQWKRVELIWVAYAAVGFGTLKLLFEDLRFGNAASLVVSLLFYGGVLILLPRMMQRRRQEPEASA